VGIGVRSTSVKTRAAVFDLGSSSFHLLVCEVCDGGRALTQVVRRRAVLQLGASLGQGGTIPQDRAAAAVAAAKRLRNQLDASGAEKAVAVGTAALREATNGPELVGRLERAIRMPIRVLDGPEEARLCLVGQKASVWTGSGPVLGLDLGGGSLEVAMSDGGGLDLATSLPVGAARLRAALGTPDPMSESQRIDAWERTSKIVYQVAPAITAVEGVTARVLLSGGTSRALARLATTRSRGSVPDGGPTVNQVELPREQVESLAKLLAPMSGSQRLALPGMNRRRAAVLPVGATILAATAAVLDIERYVVSEWGLREGAILDALKSA
jgi:exopolyphosphatase / guanosine-5'-triphosphate,3'-diphosphate pyrophosphatase